MRRDDSREGSRWNGMPKLTLGMGLLAALAGCAHSQKTAAAPEPAPAVVAQAEPAPAPQPMPEPVAAAPKPVPVDAESVYFDFDRAELKPAGEEALSAFGTLLAKHPELHVRIEGNCDERGTVQYNLALGNRRAESAKQYLERMGASEAQITTVSYGKERPRAQGHDEAAWRQNRRDDLVPDHATVSAQPVAAIR